MTTPTLTKQASLTTANARATQHQKLQKFIALRDSYDPDDAEQALRIAGELIEEFMGLVGAVIRKWRARMPRAITIIGYEDLRAAGTGGLWKALLDFDPEQGAKFTTFASNYISWTVIEEMRRADFLKDNGRRKVQRSWRAVSALENRLGREAAESEAAQASGVSVSRYRDLCAWEQRALTAELTDPLVNYLYDSDGSDPLERICAVEEALEELPTDDSEIASSVREIGQAVASIKGYFDMEGAA